MIHCEQLQTGAGPWFMQDPCGQWQRRLEEQGFSSVWGREMGAQARERESQSRRLMHQHNQWGFFLYSIISSS